MKRKALIIMGPTAVGKTAAALKLARQFSGELVAADSRQIYRGMDIGTGKDIPPGTSFNKTRVHAVFRGKEYPLGTYDISGVPVWMYDVVGPDEPFSVAQYHCLATAAITDIWRRGRIPIIVGGTGLYIRSLLSPFSSSLIPPDDEVRRIAATMDVTGLQRLVKQEDMTVWESLNSSDRQNPRRLVRKLEIIRARKNGAEEIHEQTQLTDTCRIGLTASRVTIYERIDERVEERVRQGIKQEVETLVRRGYSWELPSLSSLGYRQWKETLSGSRSDEETIRQWKYDEHAYARRQLTWMRGCTGIHLVDVTEPGYERTLESIVSTWYTTD